MFLSPGHVSVLKSWNVTGIRNALWDESHETLYSQYEARAKVEDGGDPIELFIIPLANDDNDEPNEANNAHTDAPALGTKRGRPPLSAGERVARATERIAKEQQCERIRQLPLTQRRLAASAKGTRPLAKFFAAERPYHRQSRPP